MAEQVIFLSFSRIFLLKNIYVIDLFITPMSKTFTKPTAEINRQIIKETTRRNRYNENSQFF